MSKLTPKQEKFAQCVADGMSQADAYRVAFNVRDGTKAKTCHDNAHKLMTDTAISQRIAELREQLTKKNLWSRELSVKALIQAYNIGKEKKNAVGMTGAIKELNAMHGFNAPSKHQLVDADGNPVTQFSFVVRAPNEGEI